MQRGTKRGVTLVLAVVMAVTLVGCVSLASQPEVPDVDDMLICSKALGHNRISVVADNYIRGL